MILLTAWTHLESAVQLVKAGAADYIGKPWDNDKLLATVENLLELAETTRERQRLQDEQRRRRERLAEQYDLCGIVFASDAMERAVELACRVARADVRVLITGPEWRRQGAHRADRACQFRHPQGSLRRGQLRRDPVRTDRSGVVRRRGGCLYRCALARARAASRRRTAAPCFWTKSEICRWPGQVKLLRVLETGQFEMLGSSRTRTAQVRLSSATNADLPALIREGRFREDLYYRLNVIDIAVPPLADRPADILPLARHFLGPRLQLSEDAVAALLAHDWPGNVRELRNSIERAKLLAREQYRAAAADLNLPCRAARSRRRAARREHFEPRSAGGEFARGGGNISRAAQSLGLSRQALYRRMERFNLRP